MVDVAPALHKKILADFNRQVKRNAEIQRVLKRVEKKTATYIDAYYYATEIGNCLSKALNANLTEENLPDGRLYYNIAERTVRPMLELVADMVAGVSDDIQNALNEKAGIGLKAV